MQGPNSFRSDHEKLRWVKVRPGVRRCSFSESVVCRASLVRSIDQAPFNLSCTTKNPHFQFGRQAGLGSSGQSRYHA